MSVIVMGVDTPKERSLQRVFIKLPEKNRRHSNEAIKLLPQLRSGYERKDGK